MFQSLETKCLYLEKKHQYEIIFRSITKFDYFLFIFYIYVYPLELLNEEEKLKAKEIVDSHTQP